jgi:hypothetical protein
MAIGQAASQFNDAGMDHAMLGTIRAVIHKRATHLLRITEKA